MLFVRKSTLDDFDTITAIYSHARQFMRESGNPLQWGNSHPTKELILRDMAEGTGFVAVDEADKIYGVTAFILGSDPTYNIIEGGDWLNNLPYGTIHRLASDGSRKEIFSIFLSFFKSKIDNIRVDTYKDNSIMQHLLQKHGFKKCGTIYLEDGNPRIAYHLEMHSI